MGIVNSSLELQERFRVFLRQGLAQWNVNEDVNASYWGMKWFLSVPLILAGLKSSGVTAACLFCRGCKLHLQVEFKSKKPTESMKYILEGILTNMFWKSEFEEEEF